MGCHRGLASSPSAASRSSTALRRLTVVPGCNKTGRGGDCQVKFDNLVNFRGFEDVPGQDKVLVYGGQ